MAETMIGTLSLFAPMVMYIGVFTMWGAVAFASVQCLVRSTYSRRTSDKKAAVGSLVAGIWVMAMEGYWVTYGHHYAHPEHDHALVLTEAAWTLFATYIGGLLLYRLTDCDFYYTYYRGNNNGGNDRLSGKQAD
jgi:hypothetical protein